MDGYNYFLVKFQASECVIIPRGGRIQLHAQHVFCRRRNAFIKMCDITIKLSTIFSVQYNLNVPVNNIFFDKKTIFKDLML